MLTPVPDYYAYLLRMWRVQDNEGPLWRVSLESAGLRERHTFPHLQALFAFLQAECAPVSTEAPTQAANPNTTRRPI